MPSNQAVVAALLDRHGRTYAAEAGIRLRNTPAPLFQLLCLALLASARIRAQAAVSAARALFDAGWTTPEKLAAATWAERTRVLNRSGYARYDESTSRMLAQTAELLLDRYGGDLRRLRDEAGRDPEAEREALKAFKGIGDVGVDIFFREVQLIWDELRPFADDRALQEAEALGLGKTAAALERATASPEELTRLVAALVRTHLAGDREEIRSAPA